MGRRGEGDEVLGIPVSFVTYSFLEGTPLWIYERQDSTAATNSRREREKKREKGAGNN